eukprot:1510659-Prorocentrum_lima.AAC.1
MPPQPLLANKVVFDFGVAFPSKDKSRQKRGCVAWGRYVHEKGHFAEKSSLETDPWWDMEIFCAQMGIRRGWSQDFREIFFET